MQRSGPAARAIGRAVHCRVARLVLALATFAVAPPLCQASVIIQDGNEPHDLMIRRAGQGAWQGMGIYSTDGVDGKFQQETSPGQAAVYEVNLRRAAQVFSTGTYGGASYQLYPGFITGNAGGTGWTVRYYDTKVNPPQEITQAVTTGQGWALPTSTQAFYSSEHPTATFRIEVTRDASVAQGANVSQNALLHVTPSQTNSDEDAVLAVTFAQKPTVRISDPGQNANFFAFSRILGSASDEDMSAGAGIGASSGLQKVDVHLYQETGGDSQVWNATVQQWQLNVWTPLPKDAGSGNSGWSRSTGLPAGANLPAGDYLIAATATDWAGNVSDPVVRNFRILSAPPVGWSNGNPINCGGIRWPGPTNTIRAGATGQVSAFLATDFDQRNILVEGAMTLQVVSDPCSYTWSVSGGSFQGGVNKGQGVVWVAPTTPGLYTIQLVVDDQNQANQPAIEPGTRGDNTLSANDEPQKYSVTVNVIP